MNRFTRYLALLAFGLAACQTPTPEAEPDAASATPTVAVSDPASDRAAIEALTASYQAADRAGDHATIAALYTDDAVIHPANEPAVRGRAALDAYFAENSAPQDVTFTTAHIGISEAGDLAYEVGTIASPDGPGKYLTVYRRTDAGWRIVGDSWSDDAVPTAPAD